MIVLPEPVASIFVLALGLILGSFLNVCIYRLPRGESVVWPGSRCTSCGTAIRWYQNLPVLSWLWLRGKCGTCKAPISARYPFVEALSGLALLGFWHWFGLGPAFVIVSGFALALLALFFTDLDHHLLPDRITLTMFMTGLAVSWFNPFLGEPGWGRVGASVLGAALGSGVLWGFGALYGKLRGVEAMGMGDVKMMAMVGAFAGPMGVMMTIFMGSLVGAIFGILLIPLRGRSLQDTLPFGCFLAPAALAALLFGRGVVDAYLRLVLPVQG